MIVYAFDVRDARKRDIALKLMERGNYVVSSQVLTEFYTTVTRKLPTPLSEDTARSAVTKLSAGRVVPVDKELVLAAVDLVAAERISIWDACIVRAALRAGCSVVLSEDLNSGQDYGGIVVMNPFAE